MDGSGRLGRGRRLRLVLGVAVFCAAGPGSVLAQATFSAIEVKGNQRIETATVLSYAGLPTNAPVSVGEVNAAKQRIVNSGLFETVEVTPTGRTLLIEVREFPTINQISIEGNRRINDETLEKLLTSKPRRVYSPSTADADARAITDAYYQSGRLAATVTPKIIPRSQNRVDLVFEVTESSVVEIERIGFVGNRSFSDRRLRQVLATKQAGLLRQLIRADTFVEDRVQFDIQLLTDFYRSRGFVDFKVLSVTPEFSRERDAFYLTFNIQEGQRFKFGNVDLTTDVPGLDVAQFANDIRVRTGQTYSPTRIEDTVARLERAAIENGYDFIRADPVITRNERTQTLDINFKLVRGPRILVERIDIEGNSTTLDQVIRRQFTVIEGDPFNPREIRSSAERIRALGFFGKADVETREGSAPDRVIVDVNVEEKPTGSISLGANYSINAGFGILFGLREANFLGRGQQLNFQIAAGVDNANSNLTFVEPALFGRNVTGVFDIYYRSTTDYNAYYDTTEFGFNPSISFPLSDNGRLELSYLAANNDISNVSPDSSVILQQEAGTLSTSGLGYTYSWNSKRSGLDPVSGYRFDFGQIFAGLGGDTTYVQTTGVVAYETSVWNEDVGINARLRGGALNFIDSSSRVINRFGGGYVRGFKQNGIGPRDLQAINQDALLGNYAVGFTVEADFPLGLPEEYGIKGGVFYDAGSVWGLDDDIGTNGVPVDDSYHLRQVIGASIFWTTPIGPLRFDFTNAFQKESYDETQNFNFTVATSF